MTPLGTNLQAARQAHHLTQQQVADRLNLTRQTISGWETGRTYPDLESLIKLCDLFALSLDTLVRADHGFVTDLTQKARGLKVARQSYWATMLASALLCLLLMGHIFHWPGMRLPQLSFSLLVILTSAITVVSQFVRTRYWHLVRPHVPPLVWRLIAVCLLWLGVALAYFWRNGWRLDSLVFIGSGTATVLIALIYNLRHPDRAHPE
ncbi:helix-turn-helix transcriptional regulator [Lacticaseibacillus absianus]|uniref:helix-turn-helix transcriptional regulator n=1 Tax=Lacticaseibacillus absianus TaxID=2729623 RepID=UPI0015C90EE2|nr:helix-turn-helix transcriptional regulator [Lacticaseibacillus absianus]